MTVTRRSLLWAPVAAALAVRAGGAQRLPDAAPPGAPASAGSARAPSVILERRAGGSVSQTPLQALYGTITPSDLHYEVHRAGVPDIDPLAFRLLVHGMVERPTVFTLADITALPSVTRICFLECGGNYPRNARGAATPQSMAGLTSQSEWTGVALSTLLREVGASPDARWFLAEGQDAVTMTRSAPMEKAWKDAMLAYAQNGEPLRPSQGFPLRLLMPGWEGVASVKWLRRLELGREPFMTREETSRYSEEMADGGIRYYSFTLDARSIITSPAPPASTRRGWNEIRGIAWTGRGRITRVDVTTDDGGSWQEASLDGPVLPEAHVRFRLPWHWDGRPAIIASRAVDETGYVQPTVRQLIAERGLDSPSYHMNPIVAWVIDEAGGITVKEDPWR